MGVLKAPCTDARHPTQHTEGSRLTNMQTASSWLVQDEVRFQWMGFMSRVHFAAPTSTIH